MRPARVGLLLLILALAAGPGRALVPSERLLLDRMRAAGLEEVAPLAGGPSAFRGFLPGAGGSIVALFAGCGSGADSSRRAALLAAADLARTPRRHGLELVACAGASEGRASARRVSSAWLARNPGPGERDRVLAVLHLELGELGDGAAVGLLESASGPDGRRVAPAWLAHAVLAGGRASGALLGIGDPRWPLMGQLLGRHGRPREASGAGPFLEAGVPALTLAGGVPGSGWPATLAAIVRRLDSLAGRPRDDDAFIALGGRVWSRRDLYWAGLAIFVALLVVGRPGAWRGAASGERRRRGSRYLPGFAFRMLFLAALLAAPATTLPLLAPAALLTLAPLGSTKATAAGRALAVLPAALFAACWAAALLAGRVAPWPAQPLRLGLVAAALAMAVQRIGGGRAEARPPGDQPASSASSASASIARSHSSSLV